MKPTNARHTLRVPFPYSVIRKISAPEDISEGRDVYSGHAPAQSFFDIPDDENVREYLLEAEGRKRRMPTQVHKAMRETLESNPQDFSILNGGIVLVAEAVIVDEKTRTATLVKPSIINGSQTRGELRRYFNEREEGKEQPYPVNVKFEIVVTDDNDLIGEVSIARNFQNDVMTISIAGRLGQLEELQKAFKKHVPKAKLKMSETDLSEDYVQTEKLLQVITALVPAKLWPKASERDNPNKVFTYSMKAKCLKDFQVMFDKAKDPEDAEHQMYADLYQFYLDICGEAWDLYQKWKSHPGFRGTRLHAIERDGREIVDVPDGIIFPILASLSAFARKSGGTWRILPPDSFDDKEIISAAASAYKDIAHSNPWNMGKARPCYTSLYQITSIYRRLSKTA